MTPARRKGAGYGDDGRIVTPNAARIVCPVMCFPRWMVFCCWLFLAWPPPHASAQLRSGAAGYMGGTGERQRAWDRPGTNMTAAAETAMITRVPAFSSPDEYAEEPDRERSAGPGSRVSRCSPGMTPDVSIPLRELARQFARDGAMVDLLHVVDAGEDHRGVELALENA